MLVGALILGLLGGIFGLLIGLFGYTLGGIAGGCSRSGRPCRCASNRKLLSADGMFLVFGSNFFTAIPLILSAAGGALALVAANEVKRAATT
jgi:hypothetical protein